MASSIATEAFKESPSSKTYGSEQIQVSLEKYTNFLCFNYLVLT